MRLPPLVHLHAIPRDGQRLELPGPWPCFVSEVLAATAQNYAGSGYRPPWIGYLAVEETVCVGACGFKTPPVAGAVEIAYFTFPGYEGRGVATRMAQELIKLARAADPTIAIRAQTLPGGGASTAILRKLGFTCAGTVAHPEDGEVWEWRLDPPG